MVVEVDAMAVSGTQPTPPPHRRRPRRWMRFALGTAAVVLVALGALVIGFGAGLFHPIGGRDLPSFPSLTQHPDPALHGTVAYYANDTGCVRITTASGQAAKSVLCIAPKDLAVQPKQGVKPAGPQLIWVAPGRLEVTMFTWAPSKNTGRAPDYRAGWQKIVDVRTGKVHDVPHAQVPATPSTATGPTVSPDGRQVGYSSDPATGRVRVTLTGHAGTRTLMSARGPGEYTYGLGPVFWAPNWQWIAASDDGRILVITPGPPARTRVLVTGSGGGAGGGTAGPAFAVTGADLLTAAK
jgi:hypothetical protein